MFDAIALAYEIPIPITLLGGLLFIGAWAYIAYFMGKSPMNAARWKRINCVLLIVVIAGILCVTCLFRDSGIRQIRLTPFYTVMLAQTYYDIYIQFALNIVMFIPFGAMTPFVLQGFSRHEISKTLLAAFILSLFIEIMQYAFALGYSEIDDILSNLVGTAFGLLSFVIYKAAIKRFWIKTEQIDEE